MNCKYSPDDFDFDGRIKSDAKPVCGPYSGADSTLCVASGKPDNTDYSCARPTTPARTETQTGIAGPREE